MWTSATLLVLGGTAALLLPNIAARRSSAANSRVTMLRDGVQLLRIPVYRRLLVAATLLEGSHALHHSLGDPLALPQALEKPCPYAASAG